MGILKKIFVLFIIAAVGCFVISYFTGDTSFMSVGGMVSVLIGFFSLYIAYKLLWSVMGVYLNFALIGVVCVAALYFFRQAGEGDNIQLVSVGNINYENEKTNPIMQNTSVPSDLQMSAQKIIEAAGKKQDATDVQRQDQQETVQLFAEDVPAEKEAAQNNADILQQSSSLSFWDKLKAIMAPEQSAEGPQGEEREVYNNINPFDYPSVKGYPRVVRGSVLYLNGYHFRLYGIEAPYPDQTCADKHGRSYSCGAKAITWLQNWLNNREVTCYVLGEVQNGWATAICMVDDGKYDVAAIVTNAGWAVAYTKNTDVYLSYERAAAKARRGLWGGTFYKPWDWYKIKTRKVKITIKNKGKSDDFDFWGLF